MTDGRGASRTAVLVAQGRAVADGRVAVGRFSDPLAVELLTADERGVVDQVRRGAVPPGWRNRLEYELVQACAEVVVPRSIAIDDAIRQRPGPQLVILGAGLDTRAGRMPELADCAVYEVDHPASQADKRHRAEGVVPRARTPHYVAVDLARDDLIEMLGAAGHDPAQATTWVWEGVVSYLTRAQVVATTEFIGRLSVSGSRLVVNYQAPSRTASVGRTFLRTMTTLARTPDPLAGEPQRSAWTPAAIARLFAGHGFSVRSDGDLLSRARDLQLDVRHRRSLGTGRVLVADRG